MRYPREVVTPDTAASELKNELGKRDWDEQVGEEAQAQRDKTLGSLPSPPTRVTVASRSMARGLFPLPSRARWLLPLSSRRHPTPS